MKQLIELAESKGYVRHLWFIHDSKEAYIELCLIQKWLREEKDIYIAIKEDTVFLNNVWIGDYESYEEALKEGIKKALELIK